jgi:hypothetical protein
VQVTGLSSFLELAYWSYQSQLVNFAQDLSILEKRYPRLDPYWVSSGLCLKEEDAVDLFDNIDNFLDSFKAAAPEDLSQHVYSLHGHFLNFLGHLHGDDLREWPPLPSAPSFESKHSSYAKSALKSPSKKKSKGKGAEVAPAATPSSSSLRIPTPLFHPDSVSPDPNFDFGGPRELRSPSPHNQEEVEEVEGYVHDDDYES